MLYLDGIRLSTIPDTSSYISKLPIVQYLCASESLSFSKPVTFIVGENGVGKSTLLEAIAVALGYNAEGGSRDYSFSTCDSHSELCDYITPIRKHYPKDGFFLRAESFYNTASYLDKNGSISRHGGVSLHKQSHGEAFMSLILNRFSGNGIYILDEPEAALSPNTLLSLLVAIDDLVKKNAQLIIATHSPILMAYPNADILLLTENGVEIVAYKETDHYKTTKQFLDNPERMLNLLLDD